jgi:hypothetical protein
MEAILGDSVKKLWHVRISYSEDQNGMYRLFPRIKSCTADAGR